MTIRHFIFLTFTTTCISTFGQTTVPLSFDPDVMTEELLGRFKEDITGKIEEQLKTAEGYILDQSLIREMLVPYQEYGINPDDGEYYKAIHGIYTSIKTDPNYDPRDDLKTKISDMIQTRINNYAKSFIDEESQEIYGQLKGLFDDANEKIVGILEAAERMHDLPPDDPEIETKWANELRKLGITGSLTDLIEDFENVFGQAQARYEKPIEMISMIKDGLSTEDPTNKIEILFEFGEKFGEDLPLVGSLVSNLFKLGKEVLAAAKRVGGILEENLGQGCISTDGEYVQGAEKKQKFYQHFPHIDRACPLSLSKTSGVYQHIYYNTSNASELLFYHDEDWLGSADISEDGTHAGEGDLRAIRVFLNSKGENAKAEDLVFLHQAYIKSPGFIHYRNQLYEKLNEIRSLSNQTYSALSHCDERLVENFMMDKIGMDWLTRLMKDGNRFDFGTIRIFTQGAVEDMVDQMVTNRYLSLNLPNLERIDEIIENLKDNVPVVISGKIMDNELRIPLSGARISADIPMLFENASCVRNVSSADGTFTILLNVPLAYEGKLGFTASYKGIRETEELNVNIQQTKRYEVNFFLDTGIGEISQLVISPQNVILNIGESVDFTVMAHYADDREVDVTAQAMSSATFNAASAGQFTIAASYRDKQSSAIVTVKEDNIEGETSPEETEPGSCDEATQRWNNETGKCECLPPLLENSEGKCVSPEELEKELGGENQCEELSKELILLMEAARQLNDAYVDNYRIFLLHHDKFFKEINDQAAEVCDNHMIGYTYYTAMQAAGKMKDLEEGLVSILIDITYTTTVCPDLSTMLNTYGFGSDITKLVEFFDVDGALASMSDRLTEFGCNTDDVAQNGESVAPGELDPTFVSKGGTSTEISGDGRDNDGDGLQDEIPVAGLPGYNITIALYDSGNAKDDVFNLSVEGRGSLGLTPAGGLRTYGLNLPPGTYTAEVLVVVAPDDVGTFTINILQNGISIGSLSGEPGEGSVSTLVFDVTE